MESWQSLAYCTALEMRRPRKGPVGSNPTLSAKLRGMGLLGVDTSLAPRISAGFESLILHQTMPDDTVFYRTAGSTFRRAWCLGFDSLKFLEECGDHTGCLNGRFESSASKFY